MDTTKKIKRKHIIYGIFISIFVIMLGLTIYSLTPDNFIRNLFNQYLQAKLGLEYFDFLTIYILSFLIYFVLAALLLTLWNSVLKTIKDKLSPTILNSFKILGQIIIIPFFIVAYLNQFPAFSGTLVGIAALLGTAIGFSSTKTIGNLIAGIYIILSRPFDILDYIILPGLNTEGVVREISINYTIIDTPEGNTVIMANSKLIDATIINIRHVEKEEINLKDKLDLKKAFKKTEETKTYVYPQLWAVDGNDKHAPCVKAIEKTRKKFEKNLAAPISWFILKRERLNRTYQINLAVKDPYLLLDLTGDFLNELEANYDEVK